MAGIIEIEWWYSAISTDASLRSEYALSDGRHAVGINGRYLSDREMVTELIIKGCSI